MKTGAAILVMLGTGVIGLLVGGGLGFLGGTVIGTPAAAAGGMCMTADAALKRGILTPEQARELGSDAAKANPNLAQAINNSKISVADPGEACKQLLQGLK